PWGNGPASMPGYGSPFPVSRLRRNVWLDARLIWEERRWLRRRRLLLEAGWQRASVIATPIPGDESSLQLNGATAYAEAPHLSGLSPSGWTFEVWFRDDDPTYAHPRRLILTKGDISSPEVPYFAFIDNNLLLVGHR